MNEPSPAWQAPYLAFFSEAFYRDVATRWRGLAFGYLFCLLLFAWIPSLLMLNGYIRAFRSDTLPALLEQVPQIELRNGEISTDADMPFYIRAEGETVAVIDTAASQEDLERFDTPVLLTKTHLIFEDEGSIEVFNLSDVPTWLGPIRINQSGLQALYDIVGKWLSVWILPLVAVGSFLARAVQALVLALVGLMIAARLKVDLSYAALVRLSVIALTPVILLNTMLTLFDASIGLWGLIALAMALTYLYVSIRANAQQKQTRLST